MYELSYELPKDSKKQESIGTALSPLGGHWCPHKKKKQESKKYQENLKTRRALSLLPPNLHAGNEILVNAIKNYAKAETKFTGIV